MTLSVLEETEMRMLKKGVVSTAWVVSRVYQMRDRKRVDALEMKFSSYWHQVV